MAIMGCMGSMENLEFRVIVSCDLLILNCVYGNSDVVF
jgi:hypothetical protein